MLSKNVCTALCLLIEIEKDDSYGDHLQWPGEAAALSSTCRLSFNADTVTSVALSTVMMSVCNLYATHLVASLHRCSELPL